MISQCFGLFLTTFAIGLIPSRLKGSARMMNLLAVYGAGLIVGAALLVIIPEGMTILSNSIK